MSALHLDEVDRAILTAVQEDARHNSNAEISERVGVSASTVGKRIGTLEERGVIRGYRPEVDYEEAGYPLHVLFVCTAPIADRAALVQDALELTGVVNVRELMTGENNVHIQVIGASNDDITEIARRIDQIGLPISNEILMREEYTPSSVHFYGDEESPSSGQFHGEEE